MSYTKVGSDGAQLLTTAIRNSLLVSEPAKPLLSAEAVQDLKKIGEIALVLVAMAGATAITVVAPSIWGVVAAGHKVYKMSKRATPKGARSVSQAIYYLKKHGFVHIESTGLGDYIISLTNKGKSRVNKIEFDSLRIPAARIWDKFWWCVAGDIPTKEHRAGADLLRRKLKHMGFASLQRSMWFYPFDPRKEVNTITEAYHIGKYVTVMQVSHIDQDDEKILKQHFKKLRIL